MISAFQNRDRNLVFGLRRITSAKSSGCRTLLGFVLNPPRPSWHFDSLSAVGALVARDFYQGYSRLKQEPLHCVMRPLAGSNEQIVRRNRDLSFHGIGALLPLSRAVKSALVEAQSGLVPLWAF